MIDAPWRTSSYGGGNGGGRGAEAGQVLVRDAANRDTANRDAANRGGGTLRLTPAARCRFGTRLQR